MTTIQEDVEEWTRVREGYPTTQDMVKEWTKGKICPVSKPRQFVASGGDEEAV